MYFGFCPKTTTFVLLTLMFNEEELQKFIKELRDSWRSCGLSENITISSAKSKQEVDWFSRVVFFRSLHGEFIYIEIE